MFDPARRTKVVKTTHYSNKTKHGQCQKNNYKKAISNQNHCTKKKTKDLTLIRNL